MLLPEEENQVASKLKQKYHQIRSLLWGETAELGRVAPSAGY